MLVGRRRFEGEEDCRGTVLRVADEKQPARGSERIRRLHLLQDVPSRRRRRKASRPKQ